MLPAPALEMEAPPSSSLVLLVLLGDEGGGETSPDSVLGKESCWPVAGRRKLQVQVQRLSSSGVSVKVGDVPSLAWM